MALITPHQFRTSVDDRLRREARALGRPFNRCLNLLVMERFVARLVAAGPSAFLLKGGLALELRLARARTTRDIDILARGAPDEAEALLHQAAALHPDPTDHIDFRVGPNTDAPEIDGDGVRYHGRRFRVWPAIAGRPFGDPFGVDVAVADAVVDPPDTLHGSAFLERYGLPRLTVPAYPLPTHIAEKLHALTLPRSKPNSRLKDLVDIGLLATVDGHTAARLREAIGRTFAFRASHPIPACIPPPPPMWTEPYARLQREERLPWPTLLDLHDAASALLNPVLAGAEGSWSATSGTWTVTR
jgi:hypothetical protein